MQVCTLLQTDNHASNSPLKFFTGRMPFLPPNQQRQSTEGALTVTVSEVSDVSEQFLNATSAHYRLLSAIKLEVTKSSDSYQE